MFYDSNGNDNSSKNNKNRKKYGFEYFKEMLMNPKIEEKSQEERDGDGVLIDTIGIFIQIH
jgi:hypothetical protein